MAPYSRSGSIVLCTGGGEGGLYWQGWLRVFVSSISDCSCWLKLLSKVTSVYLHFLTTSTLSPGMLAGLGVWSGVMGRADEQLIRSYRHSVLWSRDWIVCSPEESQEESKDGCVIRVSKVHDDRRYAFAVLCVHGAKNWLRTHSSANDDSGKQPLSISYTSNVI